MKQKSERKSNMARREFLKGAAAAGGAAVVVAATGRNVMASENTETITESKKPKGYQETQHVRDYYNSTRN